METYPRRIFLKPKKPKSGPTYASFVAINKHILIKSRRPNQLPVGEDLESYCKPRQKPKNDADIQRDAQRRRLFEFLRKDAEEMLRRISMPVTDATAPAPKSPNRETVSEYMHYLSNLYASS